MDARTISESYIFLRDIGVIPYAAQFADGAEIAQMVSLQRPAMLMENNGVLVLGTACWMRSTGWKGSNRRQRR